MLKHHCNYFSMILNPKFAKAILFHKLFIFFFTRNFILISHIIFISLIIIKLFDYLVFASISYKFIQVFT